jgi:glucose-1-phosphate cytidylyltransferase
VFVLCGGLGTRIKEETGFRPKPMVPIGGQPILWHIMRTYAAHGFRRFVLCLGYRGDVIRSYFLHYAAMRSDLTVNLSDSSTTVHSVDHEDDWEVTLADTGENTMTGARVARAAARYLQAGDEHFAVTYGDGLTDADLTAELEFHYEHGKIGTVLGVNPPSRFGELKLEGDLVAEFDEKPEFPDTWVNGGYFVFRRSFLEYLDPEDGCILERAPLVSLARDRQLMTFAHRGFWASMDTQRDREQLEGLWTSERAPWRV